MPVPPVLLVVDDQPFYLKLQADILRPKGYSVVTALDAIRGFMEAKRLLPQVILLDVELPDEDGYALCNRLKADPATATIPVIMLTGTTNYKLNELAFRAGAKATILKSVDKERLFNLIKVVLETERHA